VKMARRYRIGTTSYILEDGLLPNARYLAGQVQDIELILFDLDHGPSNLPSPQDVEELGLLGRENAITYSVHLPLDIRLGEDGSGRHESLVKAQKVIACTRSLEPRAYVLHLDGRTVRINPTAEALHRWEDEALHALEMVAGWAGGADRLAVENLESYGLDFLEGVLEKFPAGRCVDIGHLWLDGHDPLPYLERAIARTRVIHLHGVGMRDHQSLANMEPGRVDAVIEALERWGYAGVLTLEVFNREDFETSLAVLRESEKRTGIQKGER